MVKPGKKQVFSISGERDFEETALSIFRYQAEHCAVYKDFVQALGIAANEVRSARKIPFLPIEFFKSHRVVNSVDPVQVTFTSSGTTGTITSRHEVTDVSWYQESFRRAFNLFYGDVSNYCVLALLPSYLEREGSSLIYMVEDLVAHANNKSGFYLYEYEPLFNKLNELQQNGKPTILIGVTFALLDLTERFSIDFPELIVMETGGMKGRRREMIREELHETLKRGFGVDAIHSEYGMTELLSQAYSRGNGLFTCPPWMKIITRDTEDPLTILNSSATGGINVIDLANIYSCSFIATQDLGRLYPDGSFEVLGRYDNSDIRGCNLLIA